MISYYRDNRRLPEGYQPPPIIQVHYFASEEHWGVNVVILTKFSAPTKPEFQYLHSDYNN